MLAAGLHPRVRSGANGTHYTSDGRLPLIPGVDGWAGSQTVGACTSWPTTTLPERWPNRRFSTPADPSRCPTTPIRSPSPPR